MITVFAYICLLNCYSKLFLRGIDLESMSIGQRDALLVFRTLCKVGFLVYTLQIVLNIYGVLL